MHISDARTAPPHLSRQLLNLRYAYTEIQYRNAFRCFRFLESKEADRYRRGLLRRASEVPPPTGVVLSASHELSSTTSSPLTVDTSYPLTCTRISRRHDEAGGAKACGARNNARHRVWLLRRQTETLYLVPVSHRRVTPSTPQT